MRRVLLSIAVFLSLSGWAYPEDGLFRAGAARVDITPSTSSPVTMSGFGGRRDPFEKIHDKVYYRAIVVDDGKQKAAILVGDILAISSSFWDTVSTDIERQFDIPKSNILLCATHTHAAPSPKYRESDDMAKRLLALVQDAMDSLQPAKVGAAKGRCNVNICRVARTATGNARGGWWLGQNPDGPADKTMQVVKFESLDGRLIAVLANYAAHGTTMGQDNMQISGDHPGACSRYVETHYGDDVVVAWTSGAAGDVDPLYAYKKDFGGRISPVDVLGRIQGEEVVRLVEETKTGVPASVHARQGVVTAPGQKNKSGSRFRPSGDYEFADGDPVDIRLTVLQLDEIALCGVSGEVLSMIGQRFKKQSPLEHTMMITHANGDSGYLPNDEAYDQIGYEIIVTQVKPGVEKMIIDGFLKLIHAAK